MNERDTSPIGFFQKYLTVWVILCMAVGICIGKFLPQIPEFLNRFEYARVSIPMAILIWVMIYPMMMKVDFRSIKDVGKNPKGLFVTWIVNWLIKPFTMYGMASLFFFVVFKAFIAPELATEYLAGAVLLGAAPCTAMVFVWSALTKGDPAYTVVQVATNDLIILVAFVPIVKFLLGVSNVSVPWDTLILSVVLFVVIPLAGGKYTDDGFIVTNEFGHYFEQKTFKDYYDRLLKDADIGHFTFHALRHTFATRALERGMDYKTLSAILGHYSVAFTMDTYVHSMDEHKRNEMNKMDDMFGAQYSISVDNQPYPVLCTITADGCTAHVPDFPKIAVHTLTLDATLLEVKQQIQKALHQYKYPPIPTRQEQIVVPDNSVLVLVKAG